MLLLADATVQTKIDYVRQFAAENVIGESNLVYTTQTDLLDQESKAIDSLTAVWAITFNEKQSGLKC